MSTTLEAISNSNANFDPDLIEEFSFKKDYLNVCSDLTLIELIIDQGDTDPHGKCLSDDVYVFDNKMRRKRVHLIVTKIGMYLFTKMSKSQIDKQKKKTPGMLVTEWKLLSKY
jgi:hypothetical protein